MKFELTVEGGKREFSCDDSELSPLVDVANSALKAIANTEKTDKVADSYS